MPARAMSLKLRCFNSRTREGCDLICKHTIIVAEVSIHAPARGAIFLDFLLGNITQVSIHAPARGAIFRSAVFLTIP